MLSTAVSLVLTQHNHTLFHIWDYLEVTCLIKSCAAVQRKWSHHLWPLPAPQTPAEIRGRKRRLSTLAPARATELVPTAQHFNYLSTRLHLCLTRLPSLDTLRRNCFLRQLCRSLPNLESVQFQFDKWVPEEGRNVFPEEDREEDDDELYRRLEHLWFALLTHCARLSQVVLKNPSVREIEFMQAVAMDCSIRLSIDHKWDGQIEIPNRVEFTTYHSIWPPDEFDAWNVGHLSWLTRDVEINELLSPPAISDRATQISVSFAGHIHLFTYELDLKHQYYWYRSKAPTDATPRQLNWVYTGEQTVAMLNSLFRVSCPSDLDTTQYQPQSLQVFMEQQDAETIEKYKSAWHDGLEFHLSESKLASVKLITMSRCIDETLTRLQWPTFRETIHSLRPEVEIRYL